MKTLKQINFKNKKVTIRCGFNVPIEEGRVADDTRIRAGLETIEYILKQQPEGVLLVSHLGRPGGKVSNEFSNKPIAKHLEGLLKTKVRLIKEIDDLENIFAKNKESKSEEIYLLENIRFWKEEKENDENFGRTISENFDVYVNDCFSTSHRAHASLVQFPKFIQEKCAGLLLEKEFKKLSWVKDNPDHPAVMVIGGAKIITKLPVIENMVKLYDKVLMGGLIANEALDEKLKLDEKVLLPTDFAPAGKENQRLDIGPETMARYITEIEKADTIVWNGPMGKFEDDDCAEGTKLIARAIAKNKKAIQVIGGGETLEAVRRFSNFSDFDYVSMSGGAMLEFLAGKELPGIKALKK